VYSVHAADLDGDGDQDVIAAVSWDNKVVWFENIQGCVSDNDCPACKKCISLECGYQTNAEDVKNDCADADPCMTGLCDGAGSCGYEALDTSCADATVCNGDELCDGAGNCQAGTPLNCDDGVGCTDDSCDAVGGCQNPTNDANCTDATVCNGDETCDAVFDCQPGTPLNCDDGVGCTDDSCDAVSGCQNLTNDGNCIDANVCNGIETCDAVLDCQAGTPLNCDDGVGCTDDSCDAVSGCQSLANDANCIDATVCNGIETCDAVLDCQSGTPLNCDDGVGCTDDSCDAVSGCQNTPDGSCGDPLACIQDSDCDNGGACAVGECTADHRCRYNPDACDTQGPCAADSTCYYGYLWLEKGNALGNRIVVNSGIDTPVMQLKVTTEGVGGTLSHLQFDWHGPDRLWPGTTVVARLYEDSDSDGKIDADGSSLVKTQAVDLANGRILFADINQSLPPATENSYLVTVYMEMGTTQSSNVAGWVFPPSRLVSMLAIFLALFMVVIGRTKCPKLVLRVSMILMLLATLSCSRSGFEFSDDSRQVNLQLRSNDYVKVQCAPNEQVWIQGAPLGSDVFVLNKVSITAYD
jgi:hypothetical protein